MAYYAKTRVQHGLDDGTVVTLEPGDEITEEHGFTQADIDQLLATDAIEEHDGSEWSGDRPVGPMERVTVAEGVQGANLPSGAPETVELPEEEEETPEQENEEPVDEDDHTEE